MAQLIIIITGKLGSDSSLTASLLQSAEGDTSDRQMDKSPVNSQDNQALLDFQQRYPEQCLLLDLTQVIRNPDFMINLINQKWDLKLQSPQSFFDEQLPQPANLVNRLTKNTTTTKFNYESRFLQDCQELRRADTPIQEDEGKLSLLQEKLTSTQMQLVSTQAQVKNLEILLQAIESSKFWRLRCKWFEFKHRLGIVDVNAIYPTTLEPSFIHQTLLLTRHRLLEYAKKLKRRLPYKPQIKKAIAKTRSKLAYYTALINNEPNISNDVQYQKWLRQNYPRPQDFNRIRVQTLALAYQPLISIIVPVYNPEKQFLHQAIASVVDQIYPHWELCLVDDCSSQPDVKTILEGYCQKDRRIKVVYHQQNQHICRASNSALEIATGEYIALLDHDDRLAPHALSEIVKLLNQHPEADFIYSDEDKIDRQNIHQDPFFKPDWCPDSMLSRMYTCHLGVYRRSLVEEIGGFRVGFEGSQDYDLVLRLTEKTDHIFHLPQVLYHWRIHPQSTAANSDTKPYAALAAQKAIQEALNRRQEPGKVVMHPNFAGVYTVRYDIPERKLVSIIIPTKDLADTLNTCLKSIFNQTTYPNYEVIVINNGSVEPQTFQCFKYWQEQEPQRFRFYDYDIPFNYSQINNYAVKQAQGDYLLFLNNDTEILTPDWIEAMVEQSQRKSIGAVGSLLLYPDDTVQHAGVVMGIGGVAGHSHKNFPASVPGYISQLVSTNNYAAVTAACLMCRREVFEQVGGFETELAIAFNDVDFCLKLLNHGYRNVYLPHVVLYHYESKSRGHEDSPAKQARFAQEVDYMQQKWSEICDRDPCYNPNLSKSHEDYRLKI